jgi:putative ABC transport system permease protein
MRVRPILFSKLLHLWRRLLFYTRRGRFDRELEEEMRFHLEMKAEENLAAGVSPEEARHAAQRQFGNQTLLREVSREMWGVRSIETLFQDLRYAARMLLKNKSFTAVAGLSLTLGIGANTAIFQLLDAALLRSLPVKDPQELAEVRLADMKGARGGFARSPSVTNLIWERIRERQQSFSGVFAWGMSSVNLAPGGEERPARLLYVSGDFFNTLGVKAALGRLFTTTDDQRGCGAPGLVLSHGFWQREYGGEANVIGRKLTLADHPFEIIGVTPAGFYGMEVGSSFDLTLPICANGLVKGHNMFDSGLIWWLTVMGRLKPGWSLEQATDHMQAISPALFESTLPADYPPDGVNDYLKSELCAIPAGSGVSGLREYYKQPLLLLLAIAGSVLLLACVNLANLLLARANTRELEIAVRQALGASRARLVRQLLVESLLLAVIGAALGAALAQALSRLLVAFLSTSADSVVLDLAPDWRTLGFAASLAVLTCLLFGLAPAIRATRMDHGAAMKAGGSGRTAGRSSLYHRFSLRRALVVGQVALSLALVAGALLFSRSLGKLMTVDMGFRPEGVLIATVKFQSLNLPPDRNSAFKDELLDRLRAVQGVESAAIAYEIPLGGWGSSNVWMDGQEGRQRSTNLSRAGSDYFKTLKIQLLAGREFDARDTPGAPNVAIVNEAFARMFMNGENPVGHRFWIEATHISPVTRYEIVGLVRDTKYGDLREEFAPIAYIAAAQASGVGTGGNFMIRSRLPQSETVAAVKRVLDEINPAITVSFQGFKPMIEATVLRERLMATLSGFFGLLALLMACAGIYGILSYSIARRVHEIGVRMALGASRRDVMWLILREAFWLVIAGVVVGAPMAFASARMASTLLFGLTPADPVSFLFAALLTLVVAMMAGYLPARRATRVEPMVALRCW